MSDVKSIFRERLGGAWAKGLRYFMMIGSNGGMPILLVLAGIAFFYAYVTFLNWLPPSFPAGVLIAIVMAAVLTKCSVRTFIRRPDIVFLLPLEHKMASYFRSSLIYSSVVQAILAAIAFGLLLPLYLVKIGDEAGFFTALTFIVLFKVWNVYAYWQELRLVFGRSTHIAFRFAVNVLLTGMLFYGGSLVLYTIIAVIMLLIATYYYKRLTPTGRYPWYLLADLEQSRVNALYTAASFFVDVPHLQQRVKKRTLLSRLLNRLPYRQQNSYLYLYMRTFVRSGEYMGIYWRLTVFTAVIIVFVPNVYAALAMFVIGLVFTGVQLPAVAEKYATSVTLKLYPLATRNRTRSRSQLIFALLALQSVLLAGVATFNVPSVLFTGVFLAVGTGFSYFFSYIYLQRRLKA